MIARRSVFALAPAAAALLAGCSSLPWFSNSSVQQAATDMSTIATAFKNILPQLGTVQGISASLVAEAGTIVADLQSLAAQVAQAASTAAAQPQVQQFEADLNALVAALAGLPLPPPISTALAAAAVLLPVIEAAVGMLVPPPAPAPTPAPAPVAGAAPRMTPDQARSYLKSLHPLSWINR